MAWREITEADALGAMNAAETAAYQAAVIGIGQDPLAQITVQVVQECRGHIADCAQNQLAAGNTLPERTIYHALALIRFRMLTRLDLEVTEDRRKEQKDAIAFFHRAAECKVSIEQPEGATDTSGPVQKITLLSNHGRQSTRDNLKGL
jgi:hypothetical protein